MRNASKWSNLLTASDKYETQKEYQPRVLFNPVLKFWSKKYIKEGIEHTFETVGKKFEIRLSFNCESKNLIYIVMCSSCKGEYIRQTQTMLKKD